MPEAPQLPGDPLSGRLPFWTALTGGTGQLAWSVYSDGHLVVAGRHLILDLGALTFCDCTGLNLFLRWQRQAAAAACVLHVVAATPRLRQLTDLTGTHGLLQAGARRCHRQCCLNSHSDLRAADREPI